MLALAALGLAGLQAPAVPLFSAAVAHAEPAAAAPSAEEKRRAGAAFDRGVSHFNRAEYEAAAQAFLEADHLAPSSQAITNAIAAARKASDHLLVARASQRAIARDDVAASAARAALADAATRLARLELTCDVKDCVIQIDGGPVSVRVDYVLPGDHRIQAQAAGASDAEQLHCVAGATYQVVLHPVPVKGAEHAPPPPPPVQPPPSRGLPRAVFFTGLGATALLGGLTIWSGVDAIQAKDALPAVPEQSQNDAVLARARRSNFLLGGALLAGAGTAIVGLAFTDWGGKPVTAVVVPGPRGAFVGVGASF